MQSRSIAQIKYLEPTELFGWIKSGHASPLKEPFQIIDVRGSDYIGGHIYGSWNYPYKRIKYDSEVLVELRNRLLEKRTGDQEEAPSDHSSGHSVIHCVFHCAQSQQRGPSSAMRFLRSLPDETLPMLQIWILRGGFIQWQSMYGQDSSVTEDYIPDLWQW